MIIHHCRKGGKLNCKLSLMLSLCKRGELHDGLARLGAYSAKAGGETLLYAGLGTPELKHQLQHGRFTW